MVPTDGTARVLVLATRVEHGDHHEIGVGVAPPTGFDSGRLCRIGRPPQKPEIAESRGASEVLQADAGEFGDFLFGKNLLAGPDCDCSHGCSPYRRRQDIEILGRRIDEEQ